MNLLIKATSLDEPAALRILSIDPATTLDRVHVILQTAFGWTNSHLHMFTHRNHHIADNLFFRYPHIEEFDGDVATFTEPEEKVKLGDVLKDKGDFLEYLYDFGDHWAHRVELMGESQATHPDVPGLALYVEGRGRRENSRGAANADHDFIPEPTLEEINSEIARTHNLALSADGAFMFGHNAGPQVEKMWESLSAGRGNLLYPYLVQLRETPLPELSPEARAEILTSMSPWISFLEAAREGIPLTRAGYLLPAFCAEFIKENNIVAPSTSTTEASLPEISAFHDITKKARLTRKYKNKLLLTKKGAARLADPITLIPDLAAGTLAFSNEFDTSAELAAVMISIFSEDEKLRMPTALKNYDALRVVTANVLTDMGWRTNFNNEPVKADNVFALLRTVKRIARPILSDSPITLSPEALTYVARMCLKA